MFSEGAGGSNASPNDAAATPNFIFESGIHSVKTVNLKSDMPAVSDALQRLDRELRLARQEKTKLLKLIHGYGSTSEGGDIRIAVQKRLVEMMQSGQIRGCIFGENWSKSDEVVWSLLQSHSELKADSDLGRRNRGITIVVL
ncbi:MAG TPA: hypothetical protein VN911_05290 [Candidatus Acidoferrum sp.]|nr:hypothetical protein [Candidatus Acidoferrum sp.]